MRIYVIVDSTYASHNYLGRAQPEDQGNRDYIHLKKLVIVLTRLVCISVVSYSIETKCIPITPHSIQRMFREEER